MEDQLPLGKTLTLFLDCWVQRGNDVTCKPHTSATVSTGHKRMLEGQGKKGKGTGYTRGSCATRTVSCSALLEGRVVQARLLSPHRKRCRC